MAKQAQNGDTVTVHYTGTLDDGTVFDSSRGHEPLEFTLGAGQLICGFEDATRGLSAGESAKAHIPAAEAYGEYRGDLVAVIDREQIPADIPLEEGTQLQMGQQDGEPFIVTVTEVNEKCVTLDANHPLAGKDLNFDIELVEIK